MKNKELKSSNNIFIRVLPILSKNDEPYIKEIFISKKTGSIEYIFNKSHVINEKSKIPYLYENNVTINKDSIDNVLKEDIETIEYINLVGEFLFKNYFKDYFKIKKVDINSIVNLKEILIEDNSKPKQKDVYIPKINKRAISNYKKAKEFLDDNENVENDAFLVLINQIEEYFKNNYSDEIKLSVECLYQIYLSHKNNIKITNILEEFLCEILSPIFFESSNITINNENINLLFGIYNFVYSPKDFQYTLKLGDYLKKNLYDFSFIKTISNNKEINYINIYNSPFLLEDFKSIINDNKYFDFSLVFNIFEEILFNKNSIILEQSSRKLSKLREDILHTKVLEIFDLELKDFLKFYSYPDESSSIAPDFYLFDSDLDSDLYSKIYHIYLKDFYSSLKFFIQKNWSGKEEIKILERLLKVNSDEDFLSKACKALLFYKENKSLELNISVASNLYFSKTTLV